AVQYNINNYGWKNLALNGTTWEADISFKTSASNSLKIKAIDNAGNESSATSYTLKVDTQAPAMEINGTGLTGNVYVNRTQPKTFTVTITDTDSGFGTSPIEVKIGSKPFTSYASTSDTASPLTYTVTIPATKLEDGLLKVTATDKAGNSIEKEVCTFIVDTTAPTIDNITLEMKKNGNSVPAYKDSNGNYYVRNTQDGKLTISGISTELNVFDRITLKITKDSGTTAVVSAYKTTTTWSFADIDLNTNNWTGAKKAKVSLIAKDGIGNESAETTFDIIFDETKPMIVTGEGPDTRYNFRGDEVIKFNNLKLGDEPNQGRYSESSYGRASAVKFTVYLKDALTEDATTEGSGIKKLEYKLWASDNVTKTEAELKAAFDNQSFGWSSSGSFALTHNTSYSYYNSNDSNPNDDKYTAIGNVTRNGTEAVANISGFKPTDNDKFNYLLLRPIDNCGTPGDFTILKIKIDQTAPVVSATPSNKLTNGTTPVEISGSVSDPASGLKALHVYINNSSTPIMTINSDNETADENIANTYSYTNATYGTITYTADYSLGNAPASATWTLKLTPATGTWLKDGDEIKIQAEDWAELNGTGNMAPNPTKVAVIKMDKTAPTVTITSPSNNSTVNGKYTISGTSSDTGSNPAKLTLYYSKASTKPTALSGYTELESKQVGVNNVTLAQLVNYSFDVDFFDAALIGDRATQQTQNVWILVVATDEAGNTSVITNPYKYTIDRNQDRPTITISDKEFTGMSSSDYKKVIFGESLVYISVSDDDGQVKEIKYRATPKGGTPGSFAPITLRNGTGSFTLSSEGAQTIEFQIKDAEDGEFESGSAKWWNRVILEDSQGHKFGDSQNNDNAKIYATLDIQNPELTLTGIKAPGETTYTAPADFTKTLGGTTNQIELKIQASDLGSDIASVAAKTSVEGTTDVTVSTTTKANDGYYYLTVNCGETRYTGTGVLKLTVIATDNAGRERTAEKQFSIDNTKPGVTVASPEKNSEQSGSISVSGYFTESVKFSYAISPIATSPDNYAQNQTFNFVKNGDTQNPVSLPAKDKNNVTIVPDGVTAQNPYATYMKDLCKYVEYSDQNISTFYLYLDGSVNSASHS
ncbi:MAG: hypothetical protein IKN54_01610, partial [Lachnospiraceae bacterium]|nr:hypothetical protein [Lachnospiraceae bacterium]